MTKAGHRTAPHTAALRTVALIIVGVLVAPALTECAGWAAGRHACCANRGGMAPDVALTACCGMSEQANDAAPPEARTAGPSLKLLVPHFAALVDPGAVRVPVPIDSFAARRAAVVPLYLQQASLLI